jgi:hypothetical protein
MAVMPFDNMAIAAHGMVVSELEEADSQEQYARDAELLRAQLCEQMDPEEFAHLDAVYQELRRSRS